MHELISDYLKRHDVEHYRDMRLSAISTVRIGGVSGIVAYPDTVDKLKKTIKACNDFEIQYKILGRMSNVLFGDDYYNGVVIRTDRLVGVTFDGRQLTAHTGDTLPSLFSRAASQSLSGLEELSGIPSSLGGAIYGNAGAFGRSISELVSSVTLLDTDTMHTLTLSPRELGFAYRASSLKSGRGLIITKATLALTPDSSSDILCRAREYKQKRLSTQPIGRPSLGSVFKRCGDISAGELIDRVGLKGARVGGAEISTKHAGFIINSGGASAGDYLALMDKARDTVRMKLSKILEPEIETVNIKEV
jgi:UDP-N-acetylmuramate dehydrogenase